MDAEPSDLAQLIDIYARVSYRVHKDKREPSTEGQVAVCRARLAGLGLGEGEVLIDPGRSAWNIENGRGEMSCTSVPAPSMASILRRVSTRASISSSLKGGGGVP